MGRASGSVSQRNEAQGHITLGTYAPPSLRGYVRIPTELTSFEAGNRNKPIPAIDRPQQSFSAFVEPTGLDVRQEFQQGAQYRPALRE
jgi:hypothetical protein